VSTREGRFRVQGKDVFVWGANADILDWVVRSDFARKHLRPDKNLDPLLAALSFGPYWGFATAESYRLLHVFWGDDIGLGPYPLPDTLAQMEHRGAFYPEYREHVVHQLVVYLLGMMIYDTCPPLKTAIKAEIARDRVESKEVESEFVRRWTMAALAHDIGYVLETPLTDPNFPSQDTDFNWGWVSKKLNERLKTPLSRVPLFAAIGMTESEETRAGVMLKEISVLRELEESLNALPGCKKYWAMLSQRCGLGHAGVRSPILRVFDLHQVKDSETRPRFRDHGITSALLLLTTWRCYAHHVEKHCEHWDSRQFAELRGRLEMAKSATEQVRNRRTLCAATGAIALHNIDMHILDEREYVGETLTPSRFRIRLDGPATEGGLGPTPLAFLLGLADTLQDWGRQVFRAPRSNEQVLSSVEVGLRPNTPSMSRPSKSTFTLPF